MVAIMWAAFEPDLSTKSNEVFSALLSPNSRILSCMRHLRIHGLHALGLVVRLRQLLIAIPRDRLLIFQCEGVISAYVFNLLLQRHQKLETLCARCHFPDSQPSGLGIPLGVASVTCFSTHISQRASKGDETSRYCRSLLTKMPKLETLVLNYGWNRKFAPSAQVGLMFCEGDEDLQLSNLKCLHLNYIDLCRESRTLTRHICIFKITELRLTACDGLAPFLDELLHSFSKDGGSLARLSIRIGRGPNQSQDVIQATERLLKVCPRLTYLDVGIEHCRLIDTACIIANASTLCSLSLQTGSWSQPGNKLYYPLQAIEEIMIACVKIERLALDLPDVSLGSVNALRLLPSRLGNFDDRGQHLESFQVSTVSS